MPPPAVVTRWQRVPDTSGLASGGSLHSFYFFRCIRRLAHVCAGGRSVSPATLSAPFMWQTRFAEVTVVTSHPLSQWLKKRCCGS